MWPGSVVYATPEAYELTKTNSVLFEMNISLVAPRLCEDHNTPGPSTSGFVRAVPIVASPLVLPISIIAESRDGPPVVQWNVEVLWRFGFTFIGSVKLERPSLVFETGPIKPKHH